VRSIATFVALVALLAASISCHRHVASAAPTPAPASTTTTTDAPVAAPPAASALPPLTSAPWLERLDLPGGDVALVSVPLGATGPRPVMVASHGAGDRPEWACGGWRGVTSAYPFIVCPQGAPASDGRFYWQSTAHLTRVVDKALVALRARFGSYVADGPMLYAGFSAGVIYGASLARDRAAEFPTLMLSEGGYDQLADPSFAALFKKKGGRRVLLGCSTWGCPAKMKEALRLFQRAGVDARLNDAGPLGHNLDGRVVQSLEKDWAWLVDGSPAWARYASREASATVR
jgi:hypothetical protein